MKYLVRFNENTSFDEDDIQIIKDVFQSEIVDEVDMTDTSDRDWYEDDNSIHDIVPEFTGETFYAFFINQKKIYKWIKSQIIITYLSNRWNFNSN